MSFVSFKRANWIKKHFCIAESGPAQDAGKRMYYLSREKKWGGSGRPSLLYSYGHEVVDDLCTCMYFQFLRELSFLWTSCLTLISTIVIRLCKTRRAKFKTLQAILLE